MKIGILTFHSAHNYGAVIQCYGLQQYLASLGHQVYVIDYRPRYFDIYNPKQRKEKQRKNLKTLVKNALRNMVISRVERKRYAAFDEFITRKLNLTPYVPGTDYSDFDAIILGSDQIWNPQITGGHFDDEFFGFNAKCKVISYAASSRFVSLSEEQKLYLKYRLDKIDSISVRESSLKSLLQPFMNKPIINVIDPSLLPDVNEYNQLCTPIKEQKPYVLVYEIKRNLDTLRIAREIAKLQGLEVVELVACSSPRFYGKSFRMEAGPMDFLSYIKNAECVVTTSFHGMALSLKFQKNFYSLRQGTDADLRAESLLSKLGLLCRFIPLDSSVTSYSQLDYTEILPRLNEEIKFSKEFLINALD